MTQRTTACDLTLLTTRDSGHKWKEREMTVDHKALARSRNVLLMLIVVGALGLVSIAGYHFYVFQSMVSSNGPLLVETVLSTQVPPPPVAGQDKLTLAPAHAINLAPFALEADVLRNRYRAVDALVLTRTSIVYIIIFCGLTMVSVGSAFILFRIDDQPVNAEGKAASWGFTFTTASPGILLALTGAVLVAIPWIVDRPISFQEGPSYIGTSDVRPGVNGPKPPEREMTPVP